MDIISLVKGNEAVAVTVELTDGATGDSFDAENTTPRLKVRQKGSTSTIVTIQGDADASDYANGVVLFKLGTFLGHASVSAGYYEGEVSFEFSNATSQVVFELLNFKVRDNFS